MDTELRAHIVSELNIAQASEAVQDETLELIGELIMKELLLLIYETCDTETIKAMDALTEKGDLDGLLTYIDEHIPQGETLVAQASQTIIDQFKEKLQKSKTT